MGVTDKQEAYYEDEPRKTLARELDVLNAEWLEVTNRRRKWMDAHMKDFAKYQVGETIYEYATGRKLGVISELYRYWGKDGCDPQYDYSMNVDYQYCTGNNCYDNTSRRPISICNEAELRDRDKWRAEVANWEKVFGSQYGQT